MSEARSPPAGGARSASPSPRRAVPKQVARAGGAASVSDNFPEEVAAPDVAALEAERQAAVREAALCAMQRDAALSALCAMQELWGVPGEQLLTPEQLLSKQSKMVSLEHAAQLRGECAALRAELQL